MPLLSLSSSVSSPVSDGSVTGLVGHEHGISSTDAVIAIASSELPVIEAVMPPTVSSTYSLMLGIPSSILYSLVLATLCSATLYSSNHELTTV
jgi:hypothetical protein